MLKKIVLLLTAVTALHGAAVAQLDTNRTTATRIADLLAQLPAENTAELKANAAEVADLGQEGIVELAGMLLPPGEGDNSKLEYALGGFSFYVTQPGQEQWRGLAQSAYAQALENADDKDVKAFLIRQLQIVGGEETVAVLAPCLGDERLCGPAARALVQVGTPAAGSALLQALEGAPEANRLSLITALGDLRYQEASETLAPYADSENKELRKVTLYALSNIASPGSAKLLAGAAADGGYNFEETNATASYLRYIERLIEEGENNTAGKLARKLLKKAGGAELVHTRTAALALLNKAGSAEKYLFRAMKDDNPEYRRAALKMAGDFSGEASPAASAAWIKTLQGSGNGEVQSEIITMLGNARAAAALPAVSGFLKSDNQQVRLAAIKAMQQIGQEQALPALLEQLKSADTTEVQAVKQALLVMQGQGLTAQIAAGLPDMPSASKAALIDVLAARAAEGSLEVVLPELKSADTAVRSSAFSALASMVGSEDLPVMFSLLAEVEAEKEVSQVQDALISALAGIQGQEEQTSLVLAQMEKAAPAKRSRYLRLLASIGGEQALEAVAAAFDSGDAAMKQAALTALSTWTDTGAAGQLYRISSEAGGEQAAVALEGYIDLVSKADVPPAQKLLQLRKAMVNAKNNELKARILAEAQKTGTFPALIFIGSYLDDPGVAQAAAQGVMNIALDHKEYYGTAVRELINKTNATLEGMDSDYQKEALRKHLADMPAGEGFVSLFNGEDLSGWKGLVANPVERAKMDPDELAAAQEKADERMREGWYAEDGQLIFSGEGENICTVQQYGDFEMFVDWQIEKDGDAGIYLRGTPQVQIWDTARVDVGAQVGSGGLYNNQDHESKPLVLADNAIGDWNTFHIIMKEERVTVYLNGQLVVDSVVMENFWDRAEPIFMTEQLELQAHGTRVAYRDIYVRRLSEETEPFTLSAEEQAAGFEVLFDGTNLDKWTGNKEGYAVEGGNVVVYPDKGNGNLYTSEEYADFNFRFEFQLTPGANNGLGIRTPLEGDAAYEGMELQILDNTADIYKDLEVYQYHGSVYGVIPSKRGFLKPLGEWNQQEVIVKGSKIKVILNGEVILDGDIAGARENGTMDHREHPGLKRDTGHIGFLGHGSVLRFRNIRIKDLTK